MKSLRTQTLLATKRNDRPFSRAVGPSIALAITTGTDGVAYLLAAGEGTLTGGTGYFRNVDKAIVRCKYKVPAGSNLNGASLLLIKCVSCVIILVRS